MEDIFARLYDMTAFSNIVADPRFLIMYAIAFILRRTYWTEKMIHIGL